jgi:hypothetical protein
MTGITGLDILIQIGCVFAVVFVVMVIVSAVAVWLIHMGVRDGDFNSR